jgi:hypothetical protein
MPENFRLTAGLKETFTRRVATDVTDFSASKLANAGGLRGFETVS